ncbi:hypothetical protein LCGC14_0461470 [marine sediment metagenome]|uniref:Uncharacterized protein n=1 Tax=marine sediment metagenome TaxID=412755 RepID=A0A0F9SK16_9ZZZZ
MILALGISVTTSTANWNLAVILDPRIWTPTYQCEERPVATTRRFLMFALGRVTHTQLREIAGGEL